MKFWLTVIGGTILISIVVTLIQLNSGAGKEAQKPPPPKRYEGSDRRPLPGSMPAQP